MATTDWKYPGTCTNEDRDGEEPWTNPSYADADDGDWTQCDIKTKSYGDWLRLVNFGFTTTDIPVGSTINGIEVEKQRQAEAGSSIHDDSLYLRKTSGQVGDNKANATVWGTGQATDSYGGSADTWGTTWNHSEIVGNSDFGLDFSAYNKNTTTQRYGEIDYVKIRITYTEAAADGYKPHIIMGSHF